MPVKKLTRNPVNPAAQRLKDRLVEEWKDTSSTAAQPIILEEGGTTTQPLHLYVVWDEWDPLPQIERSEIIMDAYEETHNPNAAINVTVAMGLTPREADRLGIRY